MTSPHTGEVETYPHPTGLAGSVLPPLPPMDGEKVWPLWVYRLPDPVAVALVLRLVNLGPRAFCRTYGVMDSRNLRRVLAGHRTLKGRTRVWVHSELLHRVRQWERLGYSTTTVYEFLTYVGNHPLVRDGQDGQAVVRPSGTVPGGER